LVDFFFFMNFDFRERKTDIARGRGRGTVF
jgi:hypothetical protein